MTLSKLIESLASRTVIFIRAGEEVVNEVKLGRYLVYNPGRYIYFGHSGMANNIQYIINKSNQFFELFKLK